MRVAVPVLGLVLASGALAQHDVTDYLAQMDADGDGRVSLAEYLAYMSEGFHRLDRNRDRVLDLDELPPGPRNRVAITLEHHLANLTAAFKRQDLNGDGFLDERELALPPQ